MWIPHINVDKYNNVGISFSIASVSRFASIAFTGRLCKKDYAVEPYVIAKDGVFPYQITQSTEDDDVGFLNRWGDFSGLALDPCDDKTFWIYNEYAGPNIFGISPFFASNVTPLIPPDTEIGSWVTNVSSFFLPKNKCCKKYLCKTCTPGTTIGTFTGNTITIPIGPIDRSMFTNIKFSKGAVKIKP